MKSIIIKILLVIFLFLAILFVKKPATLEKSTYSSKQSQQAQDVYVTVKMDDQSNQILLNDYLLGVVAGEMPASFEIEAIKAQVVASRTFVYSRLLSVDNTTNSQVYLTDEQIKTSWEDHYDEYKEKVLKAIKETDGETITYQGKCISALFFSSSNGQTENVEDYFDGGAQPYLKSVDSHWDQTEDPNFERTKHFTFAQLKDVFGVDFSYQNITYKQSGRVNTIQIANQTYTGRQVREKLNLSSSDFSIQKDKTGYTFTTKGSGHGVGLSQYGAQGMAKEGYHYQDIIKHYYTGVEITKS